MKKVPISPVFTLSSARLVWPPNICVGCTKTTSNHHAKTFGFSNAWLESVTYPLCKTCRQLEEERLTALENLGTAESTVAIIGGILGVLIGIAGGGIAAWRGLGWWSILVGIIGVIVGLVLGILVAYFLSDSIVGNRHGRRWKSTHPQLPDLGYGAVSMAGLHYQDQKDGKKYSIIALRCQNDQFAEMLLMNPYYASLQMMVDGQIPSKQIQDEYFASTHT